MKKFILGILCFAMLFSAGLTLVACCKGKGGGIIPKQEDVSMVVAADANNIKIDISSEKDKVGDEKAEVIGMKAYQYYVKDELYGIDKKQFTEGDKVGEYTLGTDDQIVLKRYTENGYDNLYNKYYIIKEDGSILKGPIYATKIDAQVSTQPIFNKKSKKGIIGELVWHYKALNCSSVTLNLPINNLIYPFETFNDKDEREPINSMPTDATPFVSNGKTFYFNTTSTYFKQFEEDLKQYYKWGAEVTVVLYANASEDFTIFPQKMTYYPWSTKDTIIMGVNTSNSYGFEYYVALMEFLADRYTKNNFENGFIKTFVIGNEVDYAKDYNRISETQANFNTYMEEYSRLLRLSNLAVKKYNSNIDVAIPLTHSWAKPGYTLLGSKVQAYAPKEMLDWLNKKTKSEGDYDWAISPHSYCFTLSTSRAYEYDTLEGIHNKGMTNDYNTTSVISFANLELLDEYLNVEENKFNSQTRNVYLVEAGISSSGYYSDSASNSKRESVEMAQKVQAGLIAAAWYKVSQIDSIKVFNYYRLFDNHVENESVKFGLIDDDKNEKPAYEVWKYIDSQYSSYKAQQYLQYVSYYTKDKKLQNVENGGIKSYTDTLDIFGTGYFEEHPFDMAKATTNSLKTVYDWEDVGDMTGNAFDNISYLYDGTEKSFKPATTREGVSVKYNLEGSDEILDTLPTRTEAGTTSVVASFYENGNLLGRRLANLTVGRIETNKSVYNYDEDIFVNVSRDSLGEEGFALSNKAWIGIYRAQDEPGQETVASLSYVYINGDEKATDDKIRTYRMQDGVNATIIPAGNYFIYYSSDNEFNEVERGGYFKVLAPGQDSGTVDLSGILFEDEDFEELDDEVYSLKVKGQLPEGVTVEYEGNEKSAAGVYQVCAIFKDLEGNVLERRYAVMTILPMSDEILRTDKTEYYYGERILTTARADKDSAEQTWWVGLYVKGSAFDGSYVAFYYVKDETHKSGRTYDLTSYLNNNNPLMAGDYTVALFSTSGYEAVAAQVDIKIIDSPYISLSTDKTKYAVGEDVVVTAKGILPEGSTTYLSNLWVGLYLKQDMLFNAINPYHTNTLSSIYWYNVNAETSGEEIVLQDTEKGPSRDYLISLPGGEYRLYLFADKLVDWSPFPYSTILYIDFTIGEEEEYLKDSITLDKSTYKVGEMVTAKVISKTWSYGSWVAVYREDDTTWGNYNALGIEYKSVSQLTNATYSFTTAGLAPGRYKIVLFQDSDYIVVDEATVTFTVEEA